MFSTDKTVTTPPANGQIKPPSCAERLADIEASLMRAHCLSKAMGIMLVNDTDELAHNGSTFRAAIEEVNDCAHEAVQNAIVLVETLVGEMRKEAVV